MVPKLDKIASVAVLLTCHNRKEKTLEALNALYQQNGFNDTFRVSVFLVDDGSTDGTSEEVSRLFPDVNIIEGNGELFWNRGMHLAWQKAGDQYDFDYYLWLNDDTIMLSHALEEMLSCINALPGDNIVVGAVRSDVTGHFTYGGFKSDNTPVLPNGKLQYCKIVNGNCVLVSRAIFKSVGNLDPVFPHAIGDHDYGLRVIKSGGKVLTSKTYIGHCERNDKLPSWCYSDINLKKRIAALYSPLGNAHPKYFFIYEKRHFGLTVAVKHFLSIHLRMLLPNLWN
ncbi:glycosyltransferase family 2 protein [Pedobacter duraquae]|uniref:GT2 family glycosyltransferase n=1 Tax=Pedobacter duraquae TaxID=425511 RepID=A0A4R6IBP9_9SPHI|nr:glycosyltransferase family 2 protein [Pedobacter duraquae]TDO19026.1 GT2 family glycosyltransferase [Pedobacter duraquae]